MALIRVLSKKADSVEAAKEALSDLDLDAESAKMLEELDLESITKRINDGIAQEPKELIEDPTINIDKDNINNELTLGMLLKEYSDGPSAAAVKNILNFIVDDNIGQAKRLYDKMVTMDLLPPGVNIEQLSAKGKAEN